MTKRPGFVPIAEVGEHTDAISVYTLGLPMGFDEDRLWLHVGRTERLTRLADVGQLSVIGFRGETTEEHYTGGGH